MIYHKGVNISFSFLEEIEDILDNDIECVMFGKSYELGYPLNGWNEFKQNKFWKRTNRWDRDNYCESIWDEYLRVG